MEQIDEVQSNITKTDSLPATNTSALLDPESNVDDAKEAENVDKNPEHIGKSPEQVTKNSEQVDESPEEVAKNPEQIHENPERVEEDPEWINENPERVEENSKQIDVLAENVSQDCTDNAAKVIEDALPTNECNVPDSAKEIGDKAEPIVESLDNIVVEEVEEEIVSKHMESTKEECKKNKECEEGPEESEGVDRDSKEPPNLKEPPLAKESRKISTTKETNEKKNSEAREVCTMLDINAVDDPNAQCQALIKTLSESFDAKDQSLHDSDADADLSKLVDGNSEVMVLTVETINDSNESMEENIVLTVHEKEDLSSSIGNDVSAKQTESKKTEIVNEEFNLIDYTQEGVGTIIEVISTEIVDSEIGDSCAQQGNKQISSNHTDSEKDSVTSTTLQIINTPDGSGDDNADEENTRREGYDDTIEKEDAELARTIANSKGKTEICDSPTKVNVKMVDVPNRMIAASRDEKKAEKVSTVSVSESNKVNAAKRRSVIQDIFDDWGDENTEDDNQPVVVSKVPDTVEIELKNLLNDAKSQTIEESTIVLVNEEITCIEKVPVAAADEQIITIVEESKQLAAPKEQQAENQIAKKQHIPNSRKLLFKDQGNFAVSHQKDCGKSAKDASHDTVTLTQPSLPPMQIAPPNRNRHLTSQIVSPAEVQEALKERLREKQKVLESPPQADIIFVKKLAQRLSSKLSGGSGSSLPALIPLPQQPATVQTAVPHCDKKSTESTNTAASRESKESRESRESRESSNPDNKDLLAILEGDVDPDWSNLKPPTLTEEGKRSVKVEQSGGYSAPPKLDPLVEREIALKQLLELPISSVKKSAAKKKKTFKPAAGKSSKEAKAKPTSTAEKEVVSIDLVNESSQSVDDTRTADPLSISPVSEFQAAERNADAQDMRLTDESRSGRKRKLTEKAREHEHQQNIVKRQKVYKGKVSPSRKQPKASESQASIDVDSTTEETADSKSNETIVISTESETEAATMHEAASKQATNNNKVDDAPLEKPENPPLKPSKQSVNKKGSQSVAKSNMVMKKILRQNMPSNKKAAAMKTKLNASSKRGSSGSKVVPKSKRSTENSSGDPKPKKKIINEIDRLLQDEGVVNLLYDVEQPDKKRLIPITKSQTKVMDIQKVQRELKLRKRLVRNAVLRLRTSTGRVSKVSSRSKRTSLQSSDAQPDKKVAADSQTASAKLMDLTSQEFILPAKIRNAADASVIIRRHSSSSFSSASGSPRVSIDSPEKSEGVKLEDTATHALRSNKRRHSQEDKANAKKSKKKAAAVQKTDSATINVVDISEDKAASGARSNKKSDSKRGDKNAKQPEADETSIGKVVTRSNGAATGKVSSKTKKTTKNKVTFAKTSEPDNNEEFSKGEDVLSACLAEAATALAVAHSGSRSANSAANRKNKANANAKTSESDSSKSKMETRSQFSNKEINVRRHGNLVQLILTPSSSTKLRNALTLQVMQEFRETLSILKKDEDCRVVLLTSTGGSFCEGLELSMLLHSNKEERQVHAQEVADAVKDFIKSLASFNKPIVAGVQGAAVGLGVTMLPLFDLVIASDKATFSTPYGKLGQIAEGAAVFTLSHILGSAITSELLLGGRTLTASEALRAGLVTRVLWPDRFQVELLPTLKAMSEQSSQSMEATKALLRHSLRKKLDAALESETYLLIQHWCSTECQTAIKAYIDGKVQ